MTLHMHQLFVSPLSSRQMVLLMVALTVGTALYCLAYTALLGSRAPLSEAMLWPVLNILPWFACFEWAKRVDRWAARIGAVLITLSGVAAVNAIMMTGGLALLDNLLFQITRRVPGGLMVLGMLLLSEGIKALTRKRGHEANASLSELPLLPGQIEWVAAAGNYVELHTDGKAILHRASLSATEAALAKHGFARIHRSILVPRHQVAKVVGDCLTLRNGATFKIGNRYRSRLADISP